MNLGFIFGLLPLINSALCLIVNPWILVILCPVMRFILNRLKSVMLTFEFQSHALDLLFFFIFTLSPFYYERRGLMWSILHVYGDVSLIGLSQ